MSSLILLFSLLVPGAGAASVQPEELRMWLTVGDRRFAITLTDNAAARSFADLLPLTLDMPDLNGNEKHVSLPKGCRQMRAGRERYATVISCCTAQRPWSSSI